MASAEASVAVETFGATPLREDWNGWGTMAMPPRSRIASSVSTNGSPDGTASSTPMARTWPSALVTSIPGMPTSPYSSARSAARRLASISSWSVTASASSPTARACSKSISTGSRPS